MIPLLYRAEGEGNEPYVVRLGSGDVADHRDAIVVEHDLDGVTFAGQRGIVFVEGGDPNELVGDVVLVDPATGTLERLIRRGSQHNTLLVTERCDQLCVMCSQPPKKHHHDRFALFEEACLLAEPGAVIGISGGEPTLYKAELFALIEKSFEQRPDLEFHVLTNGQHFTGEDIERLRRAAYRNVCWGIPLYAASAALHDEIVGKSGAFTRLNESLACLLLAGARIELRTVVLTSNAAELPRLARLVTTRLQFIGSWSIMQLENIGFARNRWGSLFFDHGRDFAPVAQALDLALLFGIDVRLFNFPACSVPAAYRHLAEPSISDWKRKFAGACGDCSAQSRCSGFFEWHPETDMQAMARAI
ncbi:MAG TPA: His-Xaa-Ser system radical SAM maturase HxsC [Allosphingosinicella sp.]|jgi:His-Xaa-Ser system radical SAM maturase HxsC